jgi:hypothetical protein
MRFFAFLAMLVFAGTVVRAAPATRPTPVAAARAAKLAANVKSFQLQLNYHGEQDKPYYDLLLSVVPVPVAGADPFNPAVTVTPAEAEKIIAHLSDDGFFDRGIDISNKRMMPPAAPCYTMLVRYTDGNNRPELYERIGWERPLLARLDGLRGVLDGDSAKAMDLLLGRLAGHRKEWERQAATQPALPAFEIKCGKPEDVVRTNTEGGRVVFDITSGSGIGGATVGRAGRHWPDEVVLRVHLKGLESLRMSGDGGTTVRVSVVSHSGNPRFLHLQRGDQREGPELAKGDPGWTDVRAVDAKGKPADGPPGEGGWFELVVPKVLLSDESKTLTLDWIDYYRR